MKVGSFEVNPWVILALLLAAVAVGAVNNCRVYEEQRVSWTGKEV